MDEIRFNNLFELKARLKPALSSKVIELKRNNINYINMEDIWEYLRNYKWSNGNNLSLSMMVDDILNTNNQEFIDFMLKKIEIGQLLPKKDNNYNDVL